jgi:FkbM family methyltransferase
MGRFQGLTAVASAARKKPRLFRHCFSQEGEDMILASFFEGKKNGFYVDVGAHHPKRFSNTYHFYIRGWRGINIDATPGSMKAFRRTRPEDINVEAAVSDRDQSLEFHLFNEPALNTFDPKMAAERDGFLSFKLLRKVSVPTTTLKALLEEHLPSGKQIDFMSIDVEGLDLPVLQSNDWEKFCPTVILAEDTAAKSWSLIGNSPITEYLREWGYEPFASTFRTILYRRPQEP